MNQIDRYIRKFAEESITPQDEVILECLEYCGVYGAKDLTLEQVQEFDECRRERNGSRMERHGRTQ